MSEPTEVIAWTNGMVMVFGPDGEQMPDLQGRYDVVKDAVLKAAGDGTRFYRAKWGDWKQSMSREEWASLKPLVTNSEETKASGPVGPGSAC